MEKSAEESLRQTIKSIQRGQRPGTKPAQTSVSDVLAELFMHPALRNGQLIQHLSLNLGKVTDFELFFAENPGLAEPFFNSVNAMSEKIGDKL